MDKEKTRQLFGEFGDVRRELETVFGSAYLDHSDDTHDTPAPFDLPGFEVSGDIGPLIERRKKETPVITCEENQRLLRDHLLAIQTNGEEGKRMDVDEVWETLVHSNSPACPSYKCMEIYIAVCTEDH